MCCLHKSLLLAQEENMQCETPIHLDALMGANIIGSFPLLCTAVRQGGEEGRRGGGERGKREERRML
jgi:hypothetical protein